jgi:hypothetical protein
LPDPFGPIRAVTAPGGAVNEISRTAWTLPNDRAREPTTMPVSVVDLEV